MSTPIEQIIKTKAEIYNLDPALVLAIAKTESSLNPLAVRYEHQFYTRYIMNQTLKEPYPKNVSLATEKRLRAFSWGLFQCMGETARNLGFTGSLLSLLDPETNTDLACQLLSKLFKQHHGDVRRALLGYNGGSDLGYPGRVLAKVQNG